MHTTVPRFPQSHGGNKLVLNRRYGAVVLAAYREPSNVGREWSLAGRGDSLFVYGDIAFMRGHDSRYRTV